MKPVKVIRKMISRSRDGSRMEAVFIAEWPDGQRTSKTRHIRVGGTYDRADQATLIRDWARV